MIAVLRLRCTRLPADLDLAHMRNVEQVDRGKSVWCPGKEATLLLRCEVIASITEIVYVNAMPHLGTRDDLTLSRGVHMAEQAKASGPEWDGLRTGPVTSFFDTSRSRPGDQFMSPFSVE